MGISHYIELSLSDMQKDEPILVVASYFWSDALNAFMFGDGPVAPSLLDVYMLTGLDITSSVSLFHLESVNKHKPDTRGMMN